ncbi:MAG TPA: amidohydrolase, partial [Clostridia bacterium]|nr:amidohydrolase [Clostridia bacterium]
MEGKKELFAQLERMRPELFALGDLLFETPELGFKEIETGRIAGRWLDESGIAYEDGIALTGIK